MHNCKHQEHGTNAVYKQGGREESEAVARRGAILPNELPMGDIQCRRRTHYFPMAGSRESSNNIECIPRAIPTGDWRTKKKKASDHMTQTSSWLSASGNADAFFLT